MNKSLSVLMITVLMLVIKSYKNLIVLAWIAQILAPLIENWQWQPMLACSILVLVSAESFLDVVRLVVVAR